MKHSPPFVADGVARMREDGVERAVGVVMAPHWSGMSVETYVERAGQALAQEAGRERRSSGSGTTGRSSSRSSRVGCAKRSTGCRPRSERGRR